QTLARMERMAVEEFPGAQAPAALALEAEKPQRLFSTGDQEAVSAGFQNFARRGAALFGHFCPPDFEQARVWFRGRKGVRAGPGDEGANAVPQAARRQGPVQTPVFLDDFAGVSGAFVRLFARGDSAGEVIRD